MNKHVDPRILTAGQGGITVPLGGPKSVTDASAQPHSIGRTRTSQVLNYPASAAESGVSFPPVAQRRLKRNG